MKKQILIALKKHDRLEEMLPYLEEIAQPGTEVIFLVRCRQDGSGWFNRQLTVMQTEITTAAAVTKLAMRDFGERQLRLVEERILLACEPLKSRGVAVVVECYTGSLKKAIARRGGMGSRLVVLPIQSGRLVLKLLARFTFALGCFQTVPTPFVLVLRPRSHDVGSGA